MDLRNIPEPPKMCLVKVVACLRSGAAFAPVRSSLIQNVHSLLSYFISLLPRKNSLFRCLGKSLSTR